ncbi:hypothetical protein [Bacillus cereus group sp. BfR-BA-01408]|uniref:hypothetical protein n=1 Tax=Bacillus cereus group sp. BfR-BA-01408 TaxID=2920337 RepID=UPI001F56EB0E|nr:hypothetical protein [Bacillus cereus group sp. BfR-BA-01408]
MTETIFLNLISNLIYSVLVFATALIFRHFFKINKNEINKAGQYRYTTTVIIINPPSPEYKNNTVRTSSNPAIESAIILLFVAAITVYLFIIHKNDILEVGFLIAIIGIFLSFLITIILVKTVRFPLLGITDKYILLFLFIFWIVFLTINYTLVHPILYKSNVVNVEQSFINGGINGLIPRFLNLLSSNTTEMVIIILKLFGISLTYMLIWDVLKYKIFFTINLILKRKTFKADSYIYKLHRKLNCKNPIPRILFISFISFLLISGIMDNLWYKIISFLQSGQLEKIISGFFIEFHIYNPM